MIIDLSVPIAETHSDMMPVKRSVVDHRAGAKILSGLMEGVSYRDFPQQKALSLMHYEITTHSGTHMDAPYHYSELSEDGHPMMTIDQVPLEWCMRRGVVIQLLDDTSNCVQLDELLTAIEQQSLTIEPGNIVLLYTAGDRYLQSEKYFENYRGISAAAVEYLLDLGVNIIGIDSFSFDPPFRAMLQDYVDTQDQAVLWPTHFLGRRRPYLQLERLCNLANLLPYKQFQVCCFPIKLQAADAAWSRVVAIVEPHEEH